MLTSTRIFKLAAGAALGVALVGCATSTGVASPGTSGAAAAAVPAMSGTTVVLVHGAFADGSSWNGVIPLLQARGVPVVAVQNPLSSLADDVAATQRAIDAAPGPVVLVGHSWGGTVITQAGTGEKVRSLVYVAALAPAEGQSSAELGAPYPALPWSKTVVADKAGYLSLPAESVAVDFAQDLPAAETRLMAATQGAISVKAFNDKVSAAAWKSKPSWYIVAGQDRMIQPQAQRDFARKMNAQTVELPTSHVPMLSRPADVANVILRAAGLSL